jgi:hypothetical protein
MELSRRARSGQTSSDIFIIFVTVANLIFFTFFHKYIAWYTTELDGSVTRLSMLTDDYFIWLPIAITASILVIVANIVMIIYDRYWFRQATWIGFCLIGIAVTVSLVSIFPFDFSVIPNATAVDVVPIWVRVFFIFMAVFYGTTALVLSVKLRRYLAKQGSG